MTANNTFSLHPPLPQPLPLPPRRSAPPIVMTAQSPRQPDATGEEFLANGVRLYRAALNGDCETIKCVASGLWLRAKITKGGETVLHIAAAAKHLHVVRELVNIMDAESLALANKVGNTALCFAAVSGVVETARLMVDKNKELPNIRGSQGMTPLHMAVLLGHQHMVWYLLEVTDDTQMTNDDRIGLITSSIDTDMFDVALHILSKHRYLALHRDAKKETPLHALARKPLKTVDCHTNIWKRFSFPWTSIGQDTSNEPQAALQLVQNLWDEIIRQKEEDISKLIGYPWRLLFVAAKLGNVEFLSTLIKSYPDLIWKVDENRYTIFHIAVKHRQAEVFKLIYEIGAIKDLIATYKDDNGNNMLHLAAKLAPPDRLNCISLQMQQEALWFKTVMKIVRPEYIEAENDDHKTPQALFSEEHEELRTKGETWMRKTSESCALVATLIATVVFSAAFQLPGGENEKGNPILQRRASFVVFSMSNGVSLFTSTSSLLMFLSILTSRYAERDFLVSLPLKLMSGLILLLISIATMIVAFTATFFITFREGVKWTPIPIALIATVPVTLFALQQYPLLVDIYHSTFKSHMSLLEPRKSKLFVTTTTKPSSYLAPPHWPTSSPLEHAPTITFNRSLFRSRNRLTPSNIVDPIASEQETSVFGSYEPASDASDPPTV
ncbi:ankyrin repeat-containing protein NPR4-like [Amaranthus tricolor]|uniref:ankyrin repeat-containing protein NPR4-like n=1 Tax=Amaranthus tricolor TaxID=29722 RepID=UPI00258B635F|nr:ankyrin repeat-containing protein NPR4-like [Amaranthus tricolor]